MSARLLHACALACLLACTEPVQGIVLEPSPAQVETALARGRTAAAQRTPPDRLYAWFGSSDELLPRGFLMTKMVGLTVMSAHFALRAATPAASDVNQILAEDTFLVSAIVFGNTRTFAADSYMVLVQGDRTIKPVRVRFDGQATRTAVWPKSPAYRAKVVASFRYADIDPQAEAVLSVFPGGQGEIEFHVDLAQIE